MEDNSREVYEKMRGGQNTSQETLEKMRQETIEHAHQLEAARHAPQHPAAAGAGGSALGGSGHETGSGSTPHAEQPHQQANAEEHKTIGGMEDNSREVYEKMRGGQNTSQETLEKMRQETIEHAHQLEAARHAQPGAGAGQQGGSGGGSAQPQATPRISLGGGQPQAQSQATESTTIGGIQDNSREIYDKMRGGENTSKETLAQMRMETIERARRLAKEREDGKSKA